MRMRIIVCPLIRNKDDEYLICKMSSHRGVYPGQWGLPGGGIEPGEQMKEALMREIGEELGNEIEFDEIIPWTFRDDIREKLYPDGNIERVYMVYLIFDCLAKNKKITLNGEFEEYAWVKQECLKDYDLNTATQITFEQKGFFKKI